MTNTILVTGASGKTGRALINQLSTSDIDVVAWLRDESKEISGATHYVFGDMANPAIWEEACQGIDRLYLIIPNMHPHEIEIGKMAVEAAKSAGLSHIVYHSVLHPQTEEMPHHWQKLRVEEAIFTSGVPFTILQPTAYMQNLRPQIDTVRKSGVMRLPYRPESRLSLVDLNDVASVAARILTSSDHFWATYELVGTPPLSQIEVAQRFSEVLGRQVRAETLDQKLWAENNQHLPEYARETLLAMFRYYDRYGLAGNPTVLRHLLARPPADLKSWLVSEAEATIS